MNEHITKLEALSPLPPRNFFARWLVFHPQRRGRDFSGFQVAGLFALIMLIAAIPIITNPVPPLEDYINHLARMHVIAKIGQDLNLARFYEIDWEIVPNLIMDLVVPVLARVMNIYVAGQAFMIFIFMLIISGGLVVNRALFGRWSILPLVATPFLYNYVFLVGVVNYQFGIGLALWGLAAWIALRRRALPWRLLVSTGFVLLLFVCHLFAVGVYGIGILAYELWRLLSDRERRSAIERSHSWPADCPFCLSCLCCCSARPGQMPVNSNGSRAARSKGFSISSRYIPTLSPSRWRPF